MNMAWTQEELDYLEWALRHGGKDTEIAFDTGRTLTAVKLKVQELKRKGRDIPDRRHVNGGRKAL